MDFAKDFKNRVWSISSQTLRWRQIERGKDIDLKFGRLNLLNLCINYAKFHEDLITTTINFATLLNITFTRGVSIFLACTVSTQFNGTYANIRAVLSISLNDFVD